MRSPLIFLLLLAPAAAFAAWPPEGVHVTGATGEQQLPQVISDGAGGAFIGWGTQEPVPGYDYNGYLQHVLASGEIAPGWPANGLLVAGGPGGQGIAALAPDGAGGALVLCADGSVDPDGDLYLKRVTAAGADHPGWPAAGVPVAVAPGQQSDARMVGDGAGGAWITWYDRVDPARIRGHYTHVLGSGTRAPGWPESGKLYEPGLAYVVLAVDLLASGDGGFLACISTSATGNFANTAMFARRHGPDGEPSPLWPAEATLVCAERPGSRGSYIVSDGTGGFFAAWRDDRFSQYGYIEDDIYAQHIRGDGTRAPGWPDDGLVVSALPGVTQQYVSLCEDGLGGVYIAWMDYRAGWAQLYGQHLAGDGTPYPGWSADGRLLSNQFTYQLLPRLAWDGADGAYMSWMSYGEAGYLTYVSKLTPFGLPAPGWDPDGVRVSTLPGHQYVPSIAPDGEGGAIVAWEQSVQVSGPDIYAQRFVRDGIVAASVSLVSAEVTPGEVRLRWRVVGASRATVERRAGEGAWEVRASPESDGADEIAYTDDAVTPGARYEYRLAFADGTHGGLASVEVPLAYALALEGARPNPARGAVQVAFTLPDASPAQLALYDLAGRRLAAREVGAHGAGRHVVRLDDAPLAPGLYWAALTHGGRVLRTRAAVVR